MKLSRLRIIATTASALMLGATVSLTSTTIARAACEPVVCPAIAKICPDGEVACRVSPCNCAQVCVPEGHGCNDVTEPLAVDSGTLEAEAVALGDANLTLFTPAEPAQPAAAPGQFCGGIAGIPCPEGFVCVDVPGDDCNPQQGGADCPGRCRRGH
jgi:hypothetical protein